LNGKEILKKIKIMKKIRYLFEYYVFSVCSTIANFLGIKVKNVRLFFIYLSFATLGLGFAVYITMAFFLNLKDLLYTKRSSVFDL